MCLMFSKQDTFKSRGAVTWYLNTWALQSGSSSKPGPAIQYGFCLDLTGNSGSAIHYNYVTSGKRLNFSELQSPHLRDGGDPCIAGP